MLLTGCAKKSTPPPTTQQPKQEEARKYSLERVGPARVVQAYADGFDQLTPKEKIFSYYLYLASIAARDISIDQHHSSALEVRELLEQVYTHSAGIDAAALGKITTYLKLFWINNGFYDNLTSMKFVPECSFDEFKTAVQTALKNGAQIDLDKETLDQKLDRLKPVMFDATVQSMLTNKSPGDDWIKKSAVNYYGNDITYKEVAQWAKKNEKYPLNSKVVKENGKLVEKVWRAGSETIEPGMYAQDLEAAIVYLNKAVDYASSDYQAETVRKMIKYLRTGNPDDFRDYNIHWVKDSSTVDFIYSFIEVYLDPRGQKAEFESAIYYTDPEQTKLMQNLATYAQYYEEKAPWKDEYKKKNIVSPIANVINVIIETGGDGPVTPIGINLPNEQSIREKYGSKSVLLHNIVDAYDKSSGKDLLKEFAFDKTEIDNQEMYGSKADNLHTAMHEVIGHGSGAVSPKLQGKDPADFLPGYYNTLEEARADLVALWNAWDEKIVNIGLAKDAAEARKIGETMFQQSIRVGLTQLRRIGNSTQLEEDHMKDRALIAHYIMDNSDAVKIEKRDGKTFYHIVDFEKAHEAAGKLLTELMRIKAEGDIKAAKTLIDKYGLKVDITLRDEIQSRVKALDVAAYNGIVMPKLEPVNDASGKIVDVTVSYPCDLAVQMLEYSAFSKKAKEDVKQTSAVAKK